ncbi:MAG: hypothetical protein R3317_11350, partial [Burkholderiaceae bacterium]|nr:hypothetical protein [Burkholderiaceae bacterium]
IVHQFDHLQANKQAQEKALAHPKFEFVFSHEPRKFIKNGPSVNQVEFHPFLVQPELLKFCQSHEIQVEAWSPLMRGQIFTSQAVQLGFAVGK